MKTFLTVLAILFIALFLAVGAVAIRIIVAAIPFLAVAAIIFYAVKIAYKAGEGGAEARQAEEEKKHHT